VIDQPSFPAEQDMYSPVPESSTGIGDVADPQPKRSRVFGLAGVAHGGSWEARRTTAAALADLKGVLQIPHGLALADGR
jgi:hypothetical protein